MLGMGPCTFKANPPPRRVGYLQGFFPAFALAESFPADIADFQDLQIVRPARKVKVISGECMLFKMCHG